MTEDEEPEFSAQLTQLISNAELDRLIADSEHVRSQKARLQTCPTPLISGSIDDEIRSATVKKGRRVIAG
jgi:hypothetical protein